MITAGIASVPERSESLEKVLDSLTGQVNAIFVALNYCDHEAPKYLDNYSNVFWWVSDNRMGDSEKFAMAMNTKGYFLGCDDDIVYPFDYAEYMVDGVKQYNGLVSLHGRVYTSPIANFKQFSANYRCLGSVPEDVKVNFIGSGCCAFDTSRLKVSLTEFKIKNMADIWLSKLATEQGVPMVVLEHPRDYLTYLPQKETIWRSTKDYSEHTRILQSFIK
jgi:hypothetical protein